MTYKIGEDYQYSLNMDLRKKQGKFYTPKFIVEYIVSKSLNNIDLIQNPFVSVIDISCGAGFFLLSAYEFLKGRFIKDLEQIKSKYKNKSYIIYENGRKLTIKGDQYWHLDRLHYHLLTHCIYGADKDERAVKLAISVLKNMDSSKDIDKLNIIHCDSLVRWENESDIELKKFWIKKFDYVVGNPPYIGHKQMDMDYKKFLLEEYKEVFKDKSDISYCFFQRIEEILKDEGQAGLITSRYFMESPTGKHLRLFIEEKLNMLEIIDFYGASIFKGVGVATGIYFFGKNINKQDKVKIYKLTNDMYSFENTKNLIEVLNSDNFCKFKVNKNFLNQNRWVIISEENLNIVKKIENKSKYILRDIANTFQGVISGCDRAFILTDKEVIEKKIERELVKKWIKNSNIKQYRVEESNLNLIYSNLIDDEDKYKNALGHIGIYEERLKNRREYLLGLRKWYQLQWAREESNFKMDKIIFPYKANGNKFALDKNSLFFSADVYGLTIKDKFQDEISLEYLLGILNSKTYEFYFKQFAKKMGRGIYDYYPNALLDLKIVNPKSINLIEEYVKKILKTNENSLKVEKYKNSIDSILQHYFNFTEKEKQIINKNL